MEIRSGVGRYPALVNAGLLDEVGTYVRKHLAHETCAIVSDSNVAPLFAERVKKSLASAGVRYAHLSQGYNAVVVNRDGSTGTSILSGNNFNGAGPTAALEARRRRAS